MKTYHELIQLPTFEERLKYLQTGSRVGRETFGFDRFLNQGFYRSVEWRRVRDFVISRDYACDLGVPGMELQDQIVVHHMNPIRPEDFEENPEILVDPRFLITTCDFTHNMIHYGTGNSMPSASVERFRNDMSPWRL